MTTVDTLAPPALFATGAATDYALFDAPEFRAQYVREAADESVIALAISGMHCAGCAHTLESRVGALAGVKALDVNLALGRAELRWHAGVTPLSRVLERIDELGFTARPFVVDVQRQAERDYAAGLLRRFGVALGFGIQIMMLALVDYMTEPGELGPGLQRMMQWAALGMCLPVVGYAAQAFLASAWRALRAGGVNMDVPVSLALLLAFAGSCHALVSGAGEVYFDSIAMFTVFLLGSRYLEVRARVAAGNGLDSLSAVVPDVARQVVDTGPQRRVETVPTLRLRAGDIVDIAADEVIPVDGVIMGGSTAVDESIVSGESTPSARGPDEAVIAGSLNLGAPITVRVTAVGIQAVVGRIGQLVQRAAGARRCENEPVSRLAGWFVVGVLVIAGLTACGWLLLDPTRAMAATLAVLVAACPCALALGRPAANAAAHAGLLRQHVAAIKSAALERLARITHVVMDKTGTLTCGQSRLSQVDVLGELDAQAVRALAATMATATRHPLSRALRDDTGGTGRHLERAVIVPGRGVSGVVGRHDVLLGSRRFIEDELGQAALAGLPQHRDLGGREVWLAQDRQVVARFEFDDPLRPDAAALVGELTAAGLPVIVLSGDRPEVVRRAAQWAGIEQWRAEQLPADKLEFVRGLQRDGGRVLMIGDGVNDSPALAAADVAVAVGNAAAPAALQSDLLLLDDRLGSVTCALASARRLCRIIRQNHTWALFYNLSAVPLAASGSLPPWLAALGMSASSLLVVANGLRARRCEAAG